MPYIDRDALRKRWCEEVPGGAYFLPSEIVRSIDEQPTADVVEQSVVDQIRWERDTAIAQLAEIGKGFGEQMDDVVEVKHGKWLWVDGVRCSNCNHKLQTTGLPSYCPNCGAKMDKEGGAE